VVGIHRCIGMFSFFYDVLRISATKMSFVNDICIHGSLVFACGTWQSEVLCLTLILLTWKIGWSPNNARKWQMGFNLAFKGLMSRLHDTRQC